MSMVCYYYAAASVLQPMGRPLLENRCSFANWVSSAEKALPVVLSHRAVGVSEGIDPNAPLAPIHNTPWPFKSFVTGERAYLTTNAQESSGP